MKVTPEGGQIIALVIGVPLIGMMLIVATRGWILIVPLVALIVVLLLTLIHELIGLPRWFWRPGYHCSTCRLRAERGNK